eukprot:scaffold669931_cov42-Prasinocladus_malaysianus.AAC.1
MDVQRAVIEFIRSLLKRKYLRKHAAWCQHLGHHNKARSTSHRGHNGHGVLIRLRQLGTHWAS